MAEILARKPEVRCGTVRLVLQPMTKSEHLRIYLAKNGFAIEAELVAEEGKSYEILCCRYTGEPYVLCDEEPYVGRRGVRREDALFFRMVERKRDAFRKVVKGKQQGGVAVPDEETLCRSLEKLLLTKEDAKL